MRKLVMNLIISILWITTATSAVTFNLNTSTAPGFTDTTSTLVIRGSMNGWSGNDWEMSNIGGDYWTYASDTLSDGDYEYNMLLLTIWEPNHGNLLITVL